MKHVGRSGVVLLAVTLLLGACTMGAPLGFSDGNRWTIPVVGGLEEGVLYAPVYVEGKGPYLFEINPRKSSVIDERLARTLDIWITRTRGKMTNENDIVNHEKIDFADVQKIKVGNLTVNKRVFISVPTHGQYHGQRVMGVLGHEIFAESLVWTIDRDRQVVHLAVQGHEHVPEDAIKVKAERIKRGRFFVRAKLNDKQTYVQLDPDLPGSRVWPRVAERVGMTGQGRWKADTVTIGDLAANDVQFFEYRDKRVRKVDWDGLIGQEFFARYNVTFNWHKKAMWFSPRASNLNAHSGERIARWGRSFDGCDDASCVRGSVVIREQDNSAMLTFERDSSAAGISAEAIFQPVDANGMPAHLPNVVVSFPPGATSAGLAADAIQMYRGAAGFELIDMTPFAPPCEAPGNQGCVFLLR